MPDNCTHVGGPVSLADRAIKISTGGAVLAVAGVAAYISYWHAYAVVCAYGATGVTARLEPATIDGLVYACSMVMLYAARHHRPVPPLARWLLAVGIAATLAANMAVGWSHGPVGAVVAAWPAVSLVGSYELLMWLVRTSSTVSTDSIAAAGQVESATDQDVPPHQAEGGPQAEAAGPADSSRSGTRPGRTTTVPAGHDAGSGAGPADRTANLDAWRDADADGAAVDAYQASVLAGRPLSERELARKFGRTSRRWARNRMAEARAREQQAAAA